MKNFKKALLSILLLSLSSFSLAQSDSTNLPGLSTTQLTTPITTSGTGVPNAGSADASTTTTNTEMMVEACPTTGGNGYGYYPNGPVPTDGSITDATNIQGGVIYERSVTTDRYGTVTYGAWTEVNSLCTAIPYPPGCPSGEVQTAAPYWDWGSDQWLGLTCANPVTSATQQSSCSTAFAARSSTLATMFNEFGSDNGAMSGAAIDNDINSTQAQVQDYANGVGCWGSNAYQSLVGSSPNTGSTYELFSWNYQSGQSAGMCWVNQGTNTVVGTLTWTLIKNPGTCH
jgi:hypothetical protein